MSLIDLDNLDDQPKVASTLSLDPNESAGPLATQHSSLEAVYDHYTKQILVCDVSGSMSSSLIGTESITAYKWTNADLVNARKRIENAQVRLAANAVDQSLFDTLTNDMDDDDDEEFNADDDADAASKIPVPHQLDGEDYKNDKVWAHMDGASDEFIKAEMVQCGLTRELGVTRDIWSDTAGTALSKTEVMRDTLTKLVQDRFARWADSDIMVIEFAGRATARAAYKLDDLVSTINKLDSHGSSTNITKAVETALAQCKRAPSQVGSHHIILVTDGMDYDGRNIVKLIPQMKDLGVVLDVIHICSVHEYYDSDGCTKAMEQACTATGGEYKRVANAKDLAAKVLAAGERLCLPAPSGN